MTTNNQSNTHIYRELQPKIRRINCIREVESIVEWNRALIHYNYLEKNDAQIHRDQLISLNSRPLLGSPDPLRQKLIKTKQGVVVIHISAITTTRTVKSLHCLMSFRDAKAIH